MSQHVETTRKRQVLRRDGAPRTRPCSIGQLLVLLASGLLAVTVGPVTGALAQPQDSTTGHITEPDGRKIDLTAQSAADGSNPSGLVKINFRPDEKVTEYFDVTCLVTHGTESVISGTISHVSPPSVQTPVGGVIFWSNDNGAFGTPDTYGYVLTLAPPPCSVPSPAVIPVFQGNISVFDALPSGGVFYSDRPGPVILDGLAFRAGSG